MDYVINFWQPDFAVALLGQLVALIGCGFALAGLFWITGYIVHHLLKTLKGGV